MNEQAQERNDHLPNQSLRLPFEAGRRMAAGIPSARFVPLDSRNHLILEHEPAYARFIEEIEAFLRS